MAHLQGRALVTGATSGLGKAMASALLEAGMDVVAAARPGERLDAVVASWQAQGLRSHKGQVDVRELRSVQEFADRTLAEMGGLDLLVNNAGIGMRTVNPSFMTEPSPFFEVSPEG